MIYPDILWYNMNQIIIGLVGPIASGKGYLGKYLEERGFFYTSTSDRVRDEAYRLGISLTRKNLQDIGNELRENFGVEVLVLRCLTLIPDEAKLVVIDGMRNPGEVRFVKDQLGGQIIGIDAPAELRLRWFLERAKRRGEDGVTEADFLRADSRDLGVGESSLGQQGSMTFLMSDGVIFNDGSDRMMRECEGWLREKFGIELEGRRQKIER